MTPIEKRARECIKYMEGVCLELPWENKGAYADWLAQTYFYTRHATRVLAKAAYKCRIEEEPLHKIFLKGINEEKDHERMATSDISHVGLRLEHFKEYAETSAYYQTLYHLIDYNGPYALLGYFVTLEGLGAIGSDKLYDRIVNTHSEAAASFVKVHARIDTRHFAEGIARLNSLNKQQLEIVNHGLDLSTELYCNMIRKVTAEANEKLAAA